MSIVAYFSRQIWEFSSWLRFLSLLLYKQGFVLLSGFPSCQAYGDHILAYLRIDINQFAGSVRNMTLGWNPYLGLMFVGFFQRAHVLSTHVFVLHSIIEPLCIAPLPHCLILLSLLTVELLTSVPTPPYFRIHNIVPQFKSCRRRRHHSWLRCCFGLPHSLSLVFMRASTFWSALPNFKFHYLGFFVVWGFARFQYNAAF